MRSGIGLARLHMHDDGLYVSIGFTDTQDTILKVGGHDGPGGYKDVDHAREWVAAVQESGIPDRDLLRRLWWFSMHDDMPIWIGGQLQALVQEKLGGDEVDVDLALGNEIVELTGSEVIEIRERNRRIREGTERV